MNQDYINKQYYDEVIGQMFINTEVKSGAVIFIAAISRFFNKTTFYMTSFITTYNQRRTSLMDTYRTVCICGCSRLGYLYCTVYRCIRK